MGQADVSRAAPSRRWPLTGTGSLTCWPRTWADPSITLGARQARTIITGTIDEAVRAGKLTKHNLSDIDIKEYGPRHRAQRFRVPGARPDPVKSPIAADRGMADARLLGLRIEEALGVHRAATSAVRVFCGLPARRRGIEARSFRLSTASADKHLVTRSFRLAMDVSSARGPRVGISPVLPSV